MDDMEDVSGDDSVGVRLVRKGDGVKPITVGWERKSIADVAMTPRSRNVVDGFCLMVFLVSRCIGAL